MEHKGVVSGVGERLVEVEFTRREACAECKAKNLCGVDGEKRFVTVWEEHAAAFSVGEEVIVSASETMGMKAVLWAYIIPFFILLAGLVAGSWLVSELAAGLSALGLVAVYYVCLWFMRARIEKEIVFKVRKI